MESLRWDLPEIYKSLGEGTEKPAGIVSQVLARLTE